MMDITGESTRDLITEVYLDNSPIEQKIITRIQIDKDWNAKVTYIDTTIVTDENDLEKLKKHFMAKVVKIAFNRVQVDTPIGFQTLNAIQFLTINKREI